MYADSCCTDAGTRYHSIKIFKVNQMIVGCSGSVANINEFVRQLTETNDLFKPRPPHKIGMDDDDPEFAGLVLTLDKLYSIGTDFGADEVVGLFHAIGSGRKAALGAIHTMKLLRTGIDPLTAIRAACAADAYSALPVQWMQRGEFELHTEFY